jgi:hypothetical protein
MSKDFDFGFSMVNEDELDIVQGLSLRSQKVENEVDNLQKKCDTLYNMIMPLLDNLAKNPEKDYIKWNGKDRLSKIEEFRDRLDGVYTA